MDKPYSVVARLVISGLLACGGCTTAAHSTSQSGQRSSEAQPAPNKQSTVSDTGADRAAKRREIERKIKIAEANLEHARIENDTNNASTADTIARAEDDLALARAKFDEFKEFEAPNKIATKELELQRAQDSAAEAAEELEQIQIMYKEQDLEDMTAEFVISRGKRNADRRRQSLEITTRELQALVDYTMPREMSTLALDVARKEDALAKANRAARSDELKQRVAMMTAQAKLADLKDELAALEREKDN